METTVERGGRLGRKYVTVALAVLAGAFMISTTQQLIFGVFTQDARPLRPQADCGTHLRAMEGAVERGISASAHAADEAEASAQYQGALAPEWNDPAGVESRCAAEVPGGTDALATVLRFRAAAEQLARRHASELAPLRHDVASYLPSLPSAPSASP
jgi:hypothetical protein